MILLVDYYKILLLIGFINIVISCDITLKEVRGEKSINRDYFKIQIDGNPKEYVPHERYNISLLGSYGKRKFIAFMLGVEKMNSEEFETIGNFRLIDHTASRFDEECPNVVTHTNTILKDQIQVEWTAPSAGSGCVTFRATVVENLDIWYTDDELLNLNFCERSRNSLDTITTHCCECHEARYDLIFEGLWSRNKHPKDFPENNWLTKFSDIIGASHTINYRFWGIGQYATQGLQNLAEHSMSSDLEEELKRNSDQIRTFIKAQGVSYPNLPGTSLTAFRVDPEHPLISLVSRIQPSPDWIVGLSGLSLCSNDCNWIENAEYDLYPIDVGTHAGYTYIVTAQPEFPHLPIRELTLDGQIDYRSPFFNTTQTEMNPFARIYIKLQRIYENNNCSMSSSNSACITTEFGDWSECNDQCKRTRRRQYLDPYHAYQMRCNEILKLEANCETDCDPGGDDGGYGGFGGGGGSYHNSDDTYQPETNFECGLTEWSDWTDCSTPCGKGIMTRERYYINPSARESCEVGLRVKPLLEEEKECEERNCGGDIEQNQQCPTSPWSDWGPCSVTCGTGFKIRRRIILKQRSQHQRPSYNNNIGYGEDSCRNIRTEQKTFCSSNQACDEVEEEQPYFCNLPPDVGSCNNITNRWFFENYKNDCAIFSYNGCEGNQNNFLSRENCMETCEEKQSSRQIPIENLRYERAPEKLDCKLSDWKINECNTTCGKGYQIKTRHILVYPQNGGRPCPQQLTRLKKCFINCKNDNIDICEYSEWSPWSNCMSTSPRNGIRIRNRVSLNTELSHRCTDLMQTVKCHVKN